MSHHEFTLRDFEHPSTLFILEDKLKNLLGGKLLYYQYYRTFSLKGNESILDFGCGGGAGSKCLAGLLNENGHLTCIDFSGYWIKIAKKRLRKFANVECKCGDIRKLDIPDLMYDVISIIHVIHDITPLERLTIVQALGRRLKVGGKLFIKERIEKSHGISVGELKALLSKANLQEIKCKETKSEYIGSYKKIS